MILHDENYAFLVAFKNNKIYTLRWTNLQSKSCGIGHNKNSGHVISYHPFFILTQNIYRSTMNDMLTTPKKVSFDN